MNDPEVTNQMVVSGFTYDAQNRLLATTNAVGEISSSTYGSNGKVLTSVNTFGQTTSYLYDVRGNLIQTTYPDNTVSRSVFDERGRLTWSQERATPISEVTTAPATETQYDALGRAHLVYRHENTAIQKVTLASTNDTASIAPGLFYRQLTGITGSTQLQVERDDDGGGGIQLGKWRAGGIEPVRFGPVFFPLLLAGPVDYAQAASMNVNNGLQLVAPRVTPVLDPTFRPAVLANRAFLEGLGAGVPVGLAIEQADGSVFHFRTKIAAPQHRLASGNFLHLERIAKFLLWSRGGFRLHFEGPKELADQLASYYQKTATGKFDAHIMGERIYEKSFEVRHVQELPAERASSTPLGRHLDGCRIGFDLGGSDRKVAAVKDGECLFSEEIVWSPIPQKDPRWHFDEIMDSLKRAASYLPRVDAIGGSSAGVYVNNRVKVASLFRGVSPDDFEKHVKNIFLELQRTWNHIPFEVANDGEVTALAGSMALGVNSVLGLAMGTSTAGGYVTAEGNITTWLNELAFTPIDYSPTAAVDEWSGDYGCGVQYLSQQCVGRLLAPAGIELDASLTLAEKLKEVQKLMDAADPRALKIYQTIGTYLGYALALYASFYDIKHILILGRVTSGPGGDVILTGAEEVLRQEFPELHGAMQFHIPDEKDKRHGQAVAAASLPALGLNFQKPR